MKKTYSALCAGVSCWRCPSALPHWRQSEYGVIYDETECVGIAGLTMQGEQTLPELSETLGY